MTNRLIVVAGMIAAMLIVQVAAGAETEVRRPWSVSLEVGETYDDNRDGTKDDKEALFETSVRPSVALTKRSEMADIDFFYSPSGRYRDNPRFNQNSEDLYHDIGLDLNYKASQRLRLGLSEAFNFTDDPAIMVDERTIRENASYVMNRARIGGQYELLPKRMVVLFGAGHLVKRYEDDEYASFADEDRTGVDLETKYLMKSLINVLGSVSYSDNNMSAGEGEGFEDADRGSQVLFVGTGLEKSFTAAWMGRVRAGVDQTSYDNAETSSEVSPAADLEVAYTPSDRTRMDFSARHRIVRADISPYSTQERTSVQLNAERQLGTRLSVGVNGLYGQGDYSQETIALNSEGQSVAQRGDGTDRLASVGVSTTYKLMRLCSLRFGYQFEDWSADEQIRPQYQRNIVSLSAKANF